MKVQGLRILLTLTDPPDSSIILDEKVKAQIMEDQMKEMEKLEVYDVGEAVTNLNKGDFVYVPPRNLYQVPVLTIDGGPKALVNALDVAIIW